MAAPSTAAATANPSRYEVLLKIASGGMGTVYVGRLRGAAGFSRLVAIKRPHPHLLEQPGFRQTLISEAMLASRLHHANVVSVVDVEEHGDELLLILDYVHGASMDRLAAAAKAVGQPFSHGVAVRIILDACAGLQAAHEMKDDDGRPLGVVHRDVSPHNILIGVDGVAKLTDFGIAKTIDASTTTSTGVLKGKYSYMAPEYVRGHGLDARGDVFAMAVVTWEALTGRRLFRGEHQPETFDRILHDPAPRLSTAAPLIGTALDEVLERALAKDPDQRTASAREFAEQLSDAAEQARVMPTHAMVGRFVESLIGDDLAERRARIRVAGERSHFAATTPIGESLRTAEIEAVPESITKPLPAEDGARTLWTSQVSSSAVVPLVQRRARGSRLLLIAGLVIVPAVLVVVASLVVSNASDQSPDPRETPSASAAAARTVELAASAPGSPSKAPKASASTSAPPPASATSTPAKPKPTAVAAKVRPKAAPKANAAPAAEPDNVPSTASAPTTTGRAVLPNPYKKKQE
jgi:serine/threonine-protein kinase